MQESGPYSIFHYSRPSPLGYSGSFFRVVLWKEKNTSDENIDADDDDAISHLTHPHSLFLFLACKSPYSAFLAPLSAYMFSFDFDSSRQIIK